MPAPSQLCATAQSSIACTVCVCVYARAHAHYACKASPGSRRAQRGRSCARYTHAQRCTCCGDNRKSRQGRKKRFPRAQLLVSSVLRKNSLKTWKMAEENAQKQQLTGFLTAETKGTRKVSRRKNKAVSCQPRQIRWHKATDRRGVSQDVDGDVLDAAQWAHAHDVTRTTICTSGEVVAAHVWPCLTFSAFFTCLLLFWPAEILREALSFFLTKFLYRTGERDGRTLD